MRRTNFKYVACDYTRMNDQQYINHLENMIEDMDNKVHSFVEKMDNAMFAKTNKAQQLMETYTEEVGTLRY